MLRYGQTKRDVGLRLGEFLIAPFAGEERRQKGVVGLPNNEQVVAPRTFFFDKNHAAAPHGSLQTNGSRF
jgi:hypothetical protein